MHCAIVQVKNLQCIGSVLHLLPVMLGWGFSSHAGLELLLTGQQQPRKTGNS